MTWNLGNAILLLGTIYLYLEHGLDLGVAMLLGILGVLTWVVLHTSDDSKKLVVAQKEYYDAKADWYNRGMKGKRKYDCMVLEGN